MTNKPSKKKNYTVVSVVSGLTETQAGNLVGEFAKAKNKVAPKARATGGMTTKDKVGQLLQRGLKQITGDSDE